MSVTTSSSSLAPHLSPLISTLAWKDYKEQRAIWLAIAILAIAISLAFAFLAKGGIASARGDMFVVQTIDGFLLVLMVAQGIVCGAQLFAGEKDAGSLTFLDTLSSRRLPIWRTKLFVGSLFTLLQAVVLVSIILILGLGGWGFVPWFAAVGWLALLWGLVAGAVCDRVFPAILLGIAFVLGNFALLVVIPIQREFVQLALAGVPLVLSYRIFCAADTDRFLKDTESKKTPRRAPSSWQTLLWLAERQGRWIVWPGLGICFVAGFIVWEYRDYAWPVVTSLIGLVCGLAVFAPEQTTEQDRFLGAQRFPPGRVWLVKTLFWALAAVAMAGLYYLAVYYRLVFRGNRTDPPMFMGEFCPDRNVSLFIVEWVIYGFACGQCAALLARRIVVAGFLAVALAILLLIWWLPSLMFGGIQAWQMLTVPILLLITARLGMWDWFSGRLFTRRHGLLLTACGVAIFLWTAANLWHRAVEIPDVGEPFDLQAFNATLTKAAQSEANVAMRRGLTAMEAQLAAVDKELGSPTKPLFPLKADREPRRFNGIDRDYLAACQEILSAGWPAQDEEINRWLDAVFAGEWVRDFRAAASLPLGLMVDPRTARWEDTQSYGRMLGTLFEKLRGYATTGDLFAVRVMQLLARGQDQAALADLKVLFGLSRQVRHCLPIGFGLSWSSQMVDTSTLRALDYFAQKIGPKPDSLREALSLLQNQEKEDPDFLDSIKAYFVFIQNNPTRSWSYWNESRTQSEAVPPILQMALETPWEGERQSRFIKALYQGSLRYAQMPAKDRNPNRISLHYGLSMTDSNWTPAQWEHLMKSASVFLHWPWFNEYNYEAYHRDLRLRQLEIALMLYQIDTGHAAAKLDDLVPRYLPNVPLEPIHVEPFNYKVSQGEEIEGYFPSLRTSSKTVPLLSGQGVLWVDIRPDNTWWYSVPMMKKR